MKSRRTKRFKRPIWGDIRFVKTEWNQYVLW